MPDCFISYSTKDEPFAKAVHRDLSNQGLDVFVAAVSIKPGERWSERIQAALRESSWVLFLASKAACESAWVQQEIGRAVDGTKKLIPVVWDMPPTSLPGWANQHQALDIRGATAPQIQERVLEIARRIKQDKQRGMLVAGALLAGLFFLASTGD